MASNLDSHPKIRHAGREGREVFLFVLRRNAELNLGGVVPKIHVQPWYVAYEMMTDEVTASHGLSRCVTAGLLTETDACFVISGWDDEWAKRPLTDAERKAKQREKERETKQGITVSDGDVTKSHDAIVTGHGCHALEESRGDKKRVEEKRSDCGSSEPPSPKVPARRARSIEPDWKPRQQERDRAADAGLDADREAEHFRDHHSAKGSRMLDWDAAFRTWLRNALRFNGGRRAKALTPLEAQLERVRMLEEQERNGESR